MPLVRDPPKATLPAGVEPVAGDLNKPETLTDALAGVHAVFLLPGYADLPSAGCLSSRPVTWCGSPSRPYAPPPSIRTTSRRALVTDGHEGRIHLVSGPESLLPADQISALAKVLGRDLRCEGMTNEEARTEMEATIPVEYVDAFFSFYVDGTLDESQAER